MKKKIDIPKQFMYNNIHMIHRHNHHGVTWIDIEEPIASDITSVAKEYNLHPDCIEQLYEKSSRSKTEHFDDHTLLIIHFPDHPSQKTGSPKVELDFVIGKDYLITIRYGVLDSLLEFEKMSQVHNLIHQKKNITAQPIHMVHDILHILYNGMCTEIINITSVLDEIEEEIFKGHEEITVKRISLLRRQFIDMKHSTRFHEEVLKNFISYRVSAGDHEANIHESILNNYYKMQDALESDLEIIRELRETNDSLLTAKNNGVMKRLTLMAFVTFPLSLVAIILFDPQSPHIFHGPYGFWIVVGILTVLFLIMQIYFTYKKWI